MKARLAICGQGRGVADRDAAADSAAAVAGAAARWGRFVGAKPRMMQRQKGHTAVLIEKRSHMSKAQSAATSNRTAGRAHMMQQVKMIGLISGRAVTRRSEHHLIQYIYMCR
jgi:hypothetical protein